MRRFLATFTILVPAIAIAQAAPQPVPDTVTVTGTGRTSVDPDRFSFTVGVQTSADSVDAAVNENNTKTSAVIAALKQAGATEAEIRTSNFSIYPRQDFGPGKPPRILGYQVSNSISVRRSNVKDAGRLLQAAITAGVNTSSGLQFEVSDPLKGRDQVLSSAFQDARTKAALLAQLAGRTLGRAITITEGVTAPPPPRPMALRAAAVGGAVAEVPVESGTTEISGYVTVVFELR